MWPGYWGYLFWSHWIHRGTLPYVDRVASRLSEREALLHRQFWELLCGVLPCPSCSLHCTLNRAKERIPPFVYARDVWDYEVRFHNLVNVVNPDHPKRTWTSDEALSFWRKYAPPSESESPEQEFWLALVFLVFHATHPSSDLAHHVAFFQVLSVKLPWLPGAGAEETREAWFEWWSRADLVQAQRATDSVQPTDSVQSQDAAQSHENSEPRTVSPGSFDQALTHNLEVLASCHAHFAPSAGWPRADAETLKRWFWQDRVGNIKYNADMSRALQMRNEDHLKLRELHEDRDLWEAKYRQSIRSGGPVVDAASSRSPYYGTYDSGTGVFAWAVVSTTLLGLLVLYDFSKYLTLRWAVKRRRAARSARSSPPPPPTSE